MAAYGYVALLLLLLTLHRGLATTDELESIKNTLQDTIADTLQNSALSDPATTSLLTRGLQVVVNVVGLFLISALVAFGLYSILTWEKSTPYYFPPATGYAAAAGPAYETTGQAFTKNAYNTPEQQAYAVHQSIDQASKRYQ